MQEKYINWFRHVQKCHYNPRCKFRTIYEYACIEILDGCYYDSVKYSLYHRKPDKDHYDTPNIFSYWKDGLHSDVEIVEKLFAYNFPKLTLHNDDEMIVRFQECDRFNTVVCMFSDAQCEFRFPRSLFYQKTLDSDVEICNPDETRKMAKQLCALKSVFDIVVLAGEPWIVNNALNSLNPSYSEKLQRIADYGKNYLKRWNRFIVYFTNESLILFNPTKAIMLEISGDISKAELTENWKILQEVIKRPYFQFVHDVTYTSRSFKYDSATKTLRIFDNGPMNNYSKKQGYNEWGDRQSWKAPWDGWASDIETVIIEDGTTTIGNYAFHNCTNLTSIILPDNLTRIGDGAFEDCISLKSFTIPAGITEISAELFEGCTSLKSMIIPDCVTNIGWYAFSGCNGLTSIEIPGSITSIGRWTFIHCDMLSEFHSRIKDVSVFGVDEILDSGVKDTCTIYVPKGCVEDYRNHPAFREFRNIVEEEESAEETVNSHS